MRDPSAICSEISYLAQTYLNLEKWGFQENFRTNEMSGLRSPSIVYNSQLCKIKISFNEWHPPHQSVEYTIDVYYGRSSAPHDKHIVVWNNEECYCWHNVVKILHFLDNAEPGYAAQNLFSHNLTRQFRHILAANDLAHKQPEWEIRKHAYIWEHYAPHLFEVLDIQHPEKWEKYTQFLTQIYDIKGRSPAIRPSMDKVC